MVRYCLIMELAGAGRLAAIHGDVVAARIVADFDSRIPHVAATIRPAASADPLQVIRPGRWCLPFAVAPHSLTGDEDDPVQSTLNAARQLANELVYEILGSSAATGAALSIAVLPEADMLRLDEVLRAAAASGPDPDARRRIANLIATDGLRTFLQPIVNLRSTRLVGFEALSRGPAGSDLERADLLFGAASRGGLTRHLELACAHKALSHLDRIPGGLWLSINVSRDILSKVGAPDGLAFSDPRLVLELTEHLPVGDIPSLAPARNELRRAGASLALDDTGCGFADLETAAALDVEIVKLCITSIRRMSGAPQVIAELKRTVAEIKSQGRIVLAEGVETGEQADLLADMGVDLAQGWLFGRPAPVEDALASLPMSPPHQVLARSPDRANGPCGAGTAARSPT